LGSAIVVAVVAAGDVPAPTPIGCIQLAGMLPGVAAIPKSQGKVNGVRKESGRKQTEKKHNALLFVVLIYTYTSICTIG